jgi:rhodanese-related sulfurtransferase
MPLTLRAMLAEAEARLTRITPEEAARRQAAGGLIVDVREAPELEAGMIAGALHVPRGMLEFCADPASDFYLPDFRFERPTVVYCGIGERSALAGLTLLQMGYRDVANLPSFDAWLFAGLPVAPYRADP